MVIKYIIIDVGLGVKSIKRCEIWKENKNQDEKYVQAFFNNNSVRVNRKYLFDSPQEALDFLNNE